MTAVDEFLSDAGGYDGEKKESFKFNELGFTAKGVICEPPQIVELEDTFNKNGGKPIPKLVVTLECEDGEKRALWVSGQMKQAVAEALGASRLDVGGTLAVKWCDNKDTGKPQPMKVYKAKYEPPVKATPADDFLNDDVF